MGAELTGYAIALDRQGERYQIISIYGDDTESQPYGSYQTYELALEQIGGTEGLVIEDRTGEDREYQPPHHKQGG